MGVKDKRWNCCHLSGGSRFVWIVISYVPEHMALYPRNHNLNILIIWFSYHYLQIVSNPLLKLLNVTSQTVVLLRTQVIWEVMLCHCVNCFQCQRIVVPSSSGTSTLALWLLRTSIFVCPLILSHPRRLEYLFSSCLIKIPFFSDMIRHNMQFGLTFYLFNSWLGPPWFHGSSDGYHQWGYCPQRNKQRQAHCQWYIQTPTSSPCWCAAGHQSMVSSFFKCIMEVYRPGVWGSVTGRVKAVHSFKSHLTMHHHIPEDQVSSELTRI